MNPSLAQAAPTGLPLPPGTRLVASCTAVEHALERLAREIAADMAGLRPLVITVMNGGLVFAGQLLPRLAFPLTCDYVHVRRYGSATQGGELEWIAGPHEEIAGRHVLLLDDILDEGRTLLAVREALMERGAGSVRIAAFARKERGLPAAVEAHYVGIEVPDAFVFGFGMDVAGEWRNLPAVYALPGDGTGPAGDA